MTLKILSVPAHTHTNIICTIHFLHFSSPSSLSVTWYCRNCMAQSLSSDRVVVNLITANINSSSGGNVCKQIAPLVKHYSCLPLPCASVRSEVSWFQDSHVHKCKMGQWWVSKCTKWSHIFKLSAAGTCIPRGGWSRVISHLVISNKGLNYKRPNIYPYQYTYHHPSQCITLLS